MSVENAITTPGFSDPVRETQEAFRALMEAFAHAARPLRLETPVASIGGCSAAALTVLLTLADHDTPIWLDDPMAEDDRLRRFIAFHSGAPIVREVGAATFVFVSGPARLGDIDRFASGEPDFPDRSATVIVQAQSFSQGPHVFAGPGIPSSRGFGVNDLSDTFAAQWQLNRSRFPLGVDLVFVAGDEIAALPRSLRIVES